MTTSRPLAALVLAALLAGCGAAEEAVRSAPDLPAVEVPSGEQLSRLTEDVTAIDPGLAADPQKLAQGAARVCAEVKAGQGTQEVVGRAQELFGGPGAELTPEQAQKVVDAVKSTVCP